MKFPFHAAWVVAAMALCACSTPDTSFDELAAPASGFMPITAALPSANFCQGAAASERLRAEFNGFDSATLDRIALQSLQQCRSVLAGSVDARLEQLASR